MRYTLFNKDGEVANTNADLMHIRRHVKRVNVKRAAVMEGKRLLITLKDDSYLEVPFASADELQKALGRWTNLKRSGVKVTYE